MESGKVSDLLGVRLSAVLSEVAPCRTLADIGTDHGYAIIAALKEGLCQRAIASDVRRGPLQKARENIRQAGMEDKVSFRLCSGLEGYQAGEAETALMAGMGGRLMASLLRQAACLPAEPLKGMDRLVLEPQSEVFLVRRAVREIGFSIIRENFVQERAHTYLILCCSHVPDKVSRDRLYDAYGDHLVRTRNPLYEKNLREKLLADRALCEELRQQPPTGRVAERMASLQQEAKDLEEILDRFKD